MVPLDYSDIAILYNQILFIDWRGITPRLFYCCIPRGRRSVTIWKTIPKLVTLTLVFPIEKQLYDTLYHISTKHADTGEKRPSRMPCAGVLSFVQYELYWFLCFPVNLWVIETGLQCLRVVDNFMTGVDSFLNHLEKKWTEIGSTYHITGLIQFCIALSR